MKRETKIGALAIITIAVIAIGYNFLRGRELFSDTNTYYVVYENVDQLSVGNLITINGYRVGQVTSIKLNPENVRALTVGMRLDEDLPIPKSARAIIKSDGLLGGRFVSLDFDRACTGADCAVEGDFLTAGSESVLEALLGDPEGIRDYTAVLQEAVGPVVDSISGRLDTNTVGRTIHNLERTTQNLAILTERVNLLLAASSNNIAATTKNLAGITANLDANEATITSIMSNVDSTTSALASVDLQATLQGVDATLVDLRKTLASSSGAIENVNDLTASINRGEGTLGKLMKEDETLEQVERTLTNLDLLLQDLRLNPKRYVNVSIFGKKDKDYELPEEDPAEGTILD